MIRAFVVGAVLLAACGPIAQPADSPTPRPSPAAASQTAGDFDGTRAKAHVDWLADVARGGRYTGSPGYRDAAGYVADRFSEIGLEPWGDGGTFFQHFTTPIVDNTAMPALSRTGAAAKQYKARVDFTESVGGRSGSGSAEAEIAVVGGAARANGQNDFAGANVKGKIALVTGPVMPGGGSAVENAYAEGAAGVLVIGGATIRYSPIPRLQSATIPTLVITEDVANDLLAASGKKVSDEQAAVNARRADPNAPDSGFDVPTVVRMSVSLTPVHDVDAFNVVGLLRAPDPDAAKRAVMVGGHLDGVGTDPDGSVFQAANDNASGPAVVIEMARALSAAKASLRHSVLFVAFAGEEEGLLGSEAYAAQTAVTPGRVESLIAMIDLDVIGCCGSSLIVSSEAPELQKRVRDAATKLGISSQPIGGGGSDQTTFVRRRVPAVFVGWSDYILHTYKDVPAVVDVAHLKKAGDVLTAVAKDLATAD